MNEDLSVVGKRLPHLEACDKATGAAKYAVDIRIPGMLAGKILTSPYAHAKIKKIDKSKAEKLPGVEAVITWNDIPHKLLNPSVQEYVLRDAQNEISDMYILSEKARFCGDIIAAVAAVDQATAEAALELIQVEYEVLPAVFDPTEAIKPGAPLVHDFAKQNISKHYKSPNSQGDVEKGFQEADVIVEITLRTSKQHITPLEPCTCVASFDVSGNLNVWISSQRHFIYRRKLAELFDLTERTVNVISQRLGGGFGEANWTAIPICVALAKKTRKPVKLEYTRKESLLNTPTREAYVETGKLGLKKDGTIIALQENLLSHGGAYFSRAIATAVVNMSNFIGLYRCPNTSAEVDAVYTNVPFSGGNRGYGGPQAFLLLEQLVDMGAEELGMDPLEVRLKNLKHMGELTHIGLPLETDTQEKCIRTGAERIGWKEKRGKNRAKGTMKYGVGMATYFDVSGGQPHEIFDRNVEIKLTEDGEADVIIGIPDMGTNLIGTAAQIAAEVMGLRYEDIHMVHGETERCLWDPGIGANAGLYGVGNGVMRAATEIRKQLLEEASKKLDAAPDELDIKDRKVYIKADPSKNMTVAEICQDSIYGKEAIHDLKGHCNIFAKISFTPTLNPAPTGAVFADIEVDTETGRINILKLVLAQDCGKAINPTTVEGQLEGAATLGIGFAIFEDYYLNPQTGALESTNFNTYKIPSSLDLPDMEIALIEEPVPSGPFGAKGVGMCGMMGIGAAVANALYDAVGIRITDMPFTPEKVLQALKNK